MGMERSKIGVLIGAEGEAPASQVGARMVKIARLVARRSGTLYAMLGPIEQRDLLYLREGGWAVGVLGSRRGQQVKAFVVPVKFKKHGKNSPGGAARINSLREYNWGM
jgi:hypothetical protein